MNTLKKDDSSNNREKEAWWQPAFKLFLRLSGWVAGPVLVAAVIGTWLDKKFDSEPWGFLALVGISFPLSMIALVFEANREFKKIEKQNKNNNSEKS